MRAGIVVTTVIMLNIAGIYFVFESKPSTHSRMFLNTPRIPEDIERWGHTIKEISTSEDIDAPTPRPDHSAVVKAYELVLARKGLAKDLAQWSEKEYKYNRTAVYSCRTTGCGGWADRVKGILTTLIFAMLTKRRFMIDIDHPCRLETVMQAKTRWTHKADTGTKREFNMNRDKPAHEEFRKMITSNNFSSLDNITNVYITTNDLRWILSGVCGSIR